MAQYSALWKCEQKVPIWSYCTEESLSLPTLQGSQGHCRESFEGGFSSDSRQQVTCDLNGLHSLNDPASAACLIQFYGRRRCLLHGMQVHVHVMENNLERDPSVLNQLVQMYAKCGAFAEAFTLFDKLDNHNRVLWNLLITTLTHHGQGKEVPQLFQRMQQENILPNKVTMICMLSACASKEDLLIGKMLHARIVRSVLEADIMVVTAVLNMYAICGSLEDVHKMFSTIKNRDVVAWNSVILAFSKHGQAFESLVVFTKMLMEGVMPNKVTFIGVLEACSQLAAMTEGTWIMHMFVVDCGLERDAFVGTAIVNMHGKFGSLKEAFFVFQNLPKKDIVSWNVLLASHTQHGKFDEALHIFAQMLCEGVLPSKVTYMTILNANAGPRTISIICWMHACILFSAFEADTELGNVLISLYNKLGRLDTALYTFERMSKKNVITWTAMISAYVQHGHDKQALQLFSRMRDGGVKPNDVTYISILYIFAKQESFRDGTCMNEIIMECGFEPSTALSTTLVNMYGKYGSLDNARKIFYELPEHDLVSWTAMIAACVHHKQAQEALYLFNQMEKGGVIPDKFAFVNILSSEINIKEGEQIHACIRKYGYETDEVIGSALIRMYGKIGRLDISWSVFEELPKQNVTSWSAMISMCIQCGQAKEALQLFDQMCYRNVVPNKNTLVSVLSACAKEGALEHGEKVHSLIIKGDIHVDNEVSVSLISMYGKCGNLKVSRSIFDSIQKDTISLWNAMIGVHAQHGEGPEALQLVMQMQENGFIPDVVTFVCVIIACSHFGLVCEGSCYFASKEQIFSAPAIEHYDCFIDLLGRAGQLDEAEYLINTMPYQPTSVSYASFMGACRSLADVERGESTAKHFLELDPDNVVPCIVLSSMSTAVGQIHDTEPVNHK